MQLGALYVPPKLQCTPMKIICIVDSVTGTPMVIMVGDHATWQAELTTQFTAEHMLIKLKRKVGVKTGRRMVVLSLHRHAWVVAATLETVRVIVQSLRPSR
jgi:hypothetical protein